MAAAAAAAAAVVVVVVVCQSEASLREHIGSTATKVAFTRRGEIGGGDADDVGGGDRDLLRSAPYIESLLGKNKSLDHWASDLNFGTWIQIAHVVGTDSEMKPPLLFLRG